MNKLCTQLHSVVLMALLCGAFCVLWSPVFAAVNEQINYQGKLTNSSNVAVPDGSYDMEFSLYTQESGGSPVWTETLSGADAVAVENGLFSIMLGSTTPFTGVDFNQTLYLGVTIESDPEMSPRKVLGIVPAAFEAIHAEDADTLGGVASTSFLRSDQADIATGLLTFSNGLISQASSTIARLTTLTATTTNLVINGERFTDLTGTGLINTGNALTINTTYLNTLYASTSAFNTCSELASILSGNTTGTCGSLVLSASPTFTGTVNAAAATLSSTLTLSGTAANIALGSNFLSGDGDDEGVYVASDGKVGIGTSTLTSALTVAGDLHLSPTVGSRYLMVATSTDGLDYQGGRLVIRAGSASNFELGVGGDLVLAGGNASGYEVAAGGNVYIDGGLRSSTLASNVFLATVSTGGKVGIGESFNPGDTLSQVLSLSAPNVQMVAQESTTEFLRAGVGETANTSVLGWDDADAMHFGLYASPTDTTLDTKMVILANGSVGIGTSTPSQLLTVAGDALITGTTTAACFSVNGTTCLSSGATVAGALGQIQFNNGGTLGATSSLSYATSTGLLRIGNNSGGGVIFNEIGTAGLTIDDLSGMRLESYSDLSLAGESITFNSLNGGFHFIGYYPSDVFSVETWSGFSFASGMSGEEAEGIFVMDYQGNLGIGTSTPSARLTIQNTAGDTSLFVLASSSGDTLLEVYDNGALYHDGSWACLSQCEFYVGGGVGIGTSTPYEWFDEELVISNDFSGSSDTLIGIAKGSDAYKFGIESDGNFTFQNRSETTRYLDITSTGNVGIGTSEPGDILHLHSTTGTTLYLGTPSSAVSSGISFNDGDGTFRIDYTNNDFTFQDTGSNDLLRFDEIGGATHIYIGEAPGSRVIISGDGTTSGDYGLQVLYGMRLGGRLYDNSNSAGTNGMVLQTTGSGTQWVATSTLGIGGGGVDGSGATNRVAFWSDADTLTSNSAFTFSNSELRAPIVNIGDGTATSTILVVKGAVFLTASSTNNSISLGTFAGESYTPTSLYNTAIGQYALNHSNTSYNTALGYGAGYLSASTTSSDLLTAVGYFSGYQNSGDSVTAIGVQSGYQNRGTFGTFVGYGSGQGNSGANPVFVGYGAGQQNTGSDSIGIGIQAAYQNTGGAVTAVGYQSAAQNTANALVALGNGTFRYRNASSSVAIGYRAGYGSDLTRRSIANSTFIGFESGYAITTGNNNTLIGYRAGDALTSGSNNIVIGYDIDLPSNTLSNRLNIGNLLFGTGIDGTGTTLSSGNIGIGTTTPEHELTVAGDINFTGDLYKNGVLVPTSGEGIALTDLSETITGIDYDNTTGVFSMTSGYTIPLSASTTEWANKVSSQWTTSGSDIYYTAGKVGIGTATPAARLTVNGTGTGTNVLAQFNNSAGTTQMSILDNGNVGIGIDPSSLAKVRVSGDLLMETNGKVTFRQAGEDIYSSGAGYLNYSARTMQRFYSDTNSNDPSDQMGFGFYTQTAVGGGVPKFVILNNGNVGIGTTTPGSLLAMGKTTGLTGSVTAGIDQYFNFTNSTQSAVYYGDRTWITNAPTATSTLVGKMLRISDSTTLGNTVRGLEVQAHRGTNTQGENTALSGFARTFGVRGTTEGDAGGTYEPAGVFAETKGTTQGNAIRGYSGTITSADLLSLFHDTSAFTGTGLLMNFGNSGGSFSSTSSKFVDFQNAGTSKFTVTAHGTTTIGDGTTAYQAGLQIGYGGLCVDNDGSCNASTTGRITSVSSAVGNSDLAEMYFSDGNLEPGDIIVSAGVLSIDKADQTNKGNIIGVVSTKPGLTLGFDDSSLIAGQTGYPVALSGRVPVKLSTENGPIKTGDAIMLSSLPGVGMKAVEGGTIVGYALEDFEGEYAYSEGFVDQCGDDIAEPNTQPHHQEADTRIHDGCSFGAGGALGDENETCTPKKAKRFTNITSAVADRNAEMREALLELAREGAQEVKLENGTEVMVGQALLFVRLGGYQTLAQTDILNELTSTSTELVLGSDGEETLWDRVKTLAQSFVDGVLSIAGLRAEHIYVEHELCVDDVCVTADDLRALLQDADRPSSGSGTGAPPPQESVPPSTEDTQQPEEEGTDEELEDAEELETQIPEEGSEEIEKENVETDPLAEDDTQAPEMEPVAATS